MSTAEEISLLGYLDTPILVGDPDGCIVYANPSFRERFGGLEGDPVGEPLAMVFGGGAREVVLTATAEVLQRGQATRLQIRENGVSYSGLCSPIEAEDDRVGVVMVMLEEHSNEEHLSAIADEIGEPLAEAMASMQALSTQVAPNLLDDEREYLDNAVRQLETAQKWMKELSLVVRGGKNQQGRFDLSAAIMRVADRVNGETSGSLDLEVLMPPNMPRVAGTTVLFERLLTQLIRQRIEGAVEGAPLTLLARTLGGDHPKAVLVSLVDLPDNECRSGSGHPPESIQQGMSQMGGEAICVEDSSIGRVTSMRLAVANA